jgi:hypothetical protein
VWDENQQHWYFWNDKLGEATWVLPEQEAAKLLPGQANAHLKPNAEDSPALSDADDTHTEDRSGEDGDHMDIEQGQEPVPGVVDDQQQDELPHVAELRRCAMLAIRV